MNASDWLAQGLTGMYGLSLGLLAVALLRRPLRRLYGAELSYLLWLLPLLGLVTALLPHAGAQAAPVTLTIAAAAHAGGPSVALAGVSAPKSVEPTWWLLTAWGTGALALLGLALFAQWRLRRRLHGMPIQPSPWPGFPYLLRRADDAGSGPMLVGVLRPCIIVPRDFEQRFDPQARRMILLHELRHARRRDIATLALAVFVRALAWPNPLVWWGLVALHRDQELACDAAVLRIHAVSRRGYAETLLAAHYPTAPSIGLTACHWIPAQRFKERIAMLGQPTPSRTLRIAGRAATALLLGAFASFAYATTAAQARYAPSATRVRQASTALDSAKAGVARVMLADPGHPPGDNAQAGLPPATAFTRLSPALQRVEIRPGGVIDAHLHDAAGRATGRLVLIPFILPHGARKVSWICISPDIPGIDRLARQCRYQPGILQQLQRTRMAERHGLKISIAINGKVPRYHGTQCLADGQIWSIKEAGGNGTPPWFVRLGVHATAAGLLEFHGRLWGGSLPRPSEPSLIVLPGQTATLSVGKEALAADGSSVPQTLTITMRAEPGC